MKIVLGIDGGENGLNPMSRLLPDEITDPQKIADYLIEQTDGCSRPWQILVFTIKDGDYEVDTYVDEKDFELNYDVAKIKRLSESA